MIDPGSAAVAVGAANASTTLAKTTHGAFKTARRHFRLLGTYDPSWLSLELKSGDIAEFTATETSDIQEFLSSSSMSPVLAFYAISKLSPDGPEKTRALSIAEGTFRNEVNKWTANNESKWGDRSAKIWVFLSDLYDGTLDNELFSEVPDNEIEIFSNFISSPILSSTKNTIRGHYLTRLINLTSTLSDLTHAIDLSSHIAQLINEVDHQPIISHTEIDGKTDFNTLYVRRHFVRTDDESEVTEASLSPSENPFRFVLMGDPGAGKSTFVKHFRKSAACTETAIPVIEIVCRHYAKVAWNSSITSHAAQSISTDHSINISDTEIQNILLLGRVCLVFDGLDEITEPAKRAEMATRIQSLSIQYPVASLLVTTRVLGYERAPLSKSVFDHIRLHQFDNDQVYDYAVRWFTSRDRIDLIDSFIQDSTSVPDLRCNPLLLSLLCALYREHGALPTERRGIYNQCAELLFRRWDGHRQIANSGAMPNFANRLMLEIARWVYTTPAIQDGMEEQQLGKILAHYLTDTCGFESYEAQREATSFLEFCAGRAWLLGSFGTNPRGQRLFRFTHRTFYEFFAAEALVRGANTIDDICKYVKESFTNDATSVVPELVIQAYDMGKERGGPDVFKELVRDGSPNILLLRLMEGIILPSYLRTQAFDSITSAWSPQNVSEEEFDALLGLNIQARNHFTKEYLPTAIGRLSEESRLTFMEGWAGRVLSGYLGRYFDYWNPISIEIMESWKSSKTMSNSLVCSNWSIFHGIETERIWLGWDAIACPSMSGVVPGIAWWSIEQKFGRGEPIPENEYRDFVISTAHNLIIDGAQIPYPLIGEFHSSILWNGAENLDWQDTPHRSEVEGHLVDLLVYIVCFLHEANESTAHLLSAFNKIPELRLSEVFKWRDYRLGLSPKPTQKEENIAKSTIRILTPGLQKWCKGNSSYILYEDNTH